MERPAGLNTILLVGALLAGSLLMGGCAGCEPNPCNGPNQCNQPNPCNAPNPCNQEQGRPYGMSPTRPTVKEGGSGWR